MQLESTESDSPAGQRWELIDKYGRRHTSLRISVTDACNIRCKYCMPAVVSGFLSQDRLLSYDAIARIVQVLAPAGIRKVRLTGGEPLMRPDLFKLVEKLRSVSGLTQIAMTTNGMMLRDSLDRLVQAGLSHVNISLDTLREPAFREISRRDGLEKVLEGVEAAVRSPLHVRLNALILKDINLEDLIPLVRYARELRIVIRFIEFMPLDASRAWSADQVVTGDELRRIVESEFGALTPADSSDPSQPARDYFFEDKIGGIGFIDPVSKPFCSDCNRLRLTADGKFRNCLFGQDEWDVKPLLVLPQSESADDAIYQLVRTCVEQKHPSHGISQIGFHPPERAMYQIGG